MKQEQAMQAVAEEVQWVESDLPGMFVLEGELAAVTGDASESPQLNALMPVLNRLRHAFGMEMVFIGQLKNGKLAARDAAPDEACNPFEEAYGRGLLEGRCGPSLCDAVSVCSDEGVEAGTLVCGVIADGGFQPPPESLKSVSRLLATSMRRATTRIAAAC
jgi:hypothetical protein